MRAKYRVPVKNQLLAACAALAMLAFGSSANADAVRITFDSAVGSGHADLTLGPAGADDVIDPNHVPMAITGATGNLNGVKITGVLGINPTVPPEGESLIPKSYTLFGIDGVGDHDGVSYDNLFYPTGSPAICWIVDKEHPDGHFAFPFYGGMFDLMGVMFTLDDGSLLDLWSFGVVDPDVPGYMPPFVSGLTYGMKLIQPTEGDGWQVLDRPPFGTASVITVPESDAFWLLGAALLGLFVWRRSREARKQGPQIV